MSNDGLIYCKPKLSHKFIYLLFFVASTLVDSHNAKVISKSMLCVDAKCEELYGVGKTVSKYQKESDEMLFFKKDSNVTIFGKTEDDKQLYVEINKKRGFVPKSLIQERKIFNKDLNTKVPIDLEKVKSDLKNVQNTNTPEASFEGSSAESVPSAIQQTPALERPTSPETIAQSEPSNIDASYLYSPKFTVIDGTTINDEDILQTPSPTFSGNIENTKTATVEVNFSNSELVQPSDSKTINNEDIPINLTKDPPTIDQTSFDSAQSNGTNISKPILVADQEKTDLEEHNLDDKIEKSVNLETQGAEEQNNETQNKEDQIEESKPVETVELSETNKENEIISENILNFSPQDSVKVEQPENTNNLSAMKNIDEKSDESNLIGIDEQTQINIDMNKKIENELEEKAIIDLVPQTEELDQTEIHLEENLIIEHADKSIIQTNETNILAENDTKTIESIVELSNDIAAELVAPKAADEPYVASINSQEPLNFTEGLTSPIIDDSQLSNLKSDEDVISPDSPVAPNQLPNLNIPKISIELLRNRNRLNEPQVDTMIDPVSIVNNYVTPHNNVEQSDSMLNSENYKPNIDSVSSNSNFKASAQEIHRAPHRFGLSTPSPQSEFPVPSTEIPSVDNHQHSHSVEETRSEALTHPNQTPFVVSNETGSSGFFRVIIDVLPDEVQLFFENYRLPLHAVIFFSIICFFWCVMNVVIHFVSSTKRERDLKEILTHAQSRMFHFEGEKGKFLSEISHLKEQLSRVSSNVHEAETKNNANQFDCDKLKNENSNLRKENISLSNKMQTASQFHSKLESAMKENEKLKAKSKAKNDLIAELEADLTNNTELINRLEKSNKSREKEIEELIGKNKSLFEESEQLKFLIKEIEQNFEVVELENKELKRLKNKLTDDLKNYKDEILSLEEKVKNYDEKCQLLDKDLKTSNDSLTSIITELEAKNSEIIAMQTLLNKLNQNINKEHMRRQLSSDLNGHFVGDGAGNENDSALSDSFSEITKSSLETDGDFQDIVKLQIGLANLEREKHSLQVSYDAIHDQLNNSMKEIEKIKEENVQLKEKAEKAESERAKAVIERDVMSKYYEEKELRFSKEIGLQIMQREIKENNADTVEKQYEASQISNVLLREQLESTKKELTQTETRYKVMISQMEKQSHDNWISARDAHKKYEEARAEAAALRQTLVESVRYPPTSNTGLSFADYLDDSASSVSSLPDGFNLSGFLPPAPPPPPLPMMLSPMYSQIPSMSPGRMYNNSVDPDTSSAPVWNPPVIQGGIQPHSVASYTGPQSLESSSVGLDLGF